MNAVKKPTSELWFIMVEKFPGQWSRVGRWHAKKESAKSWVPFVKAAWHGMPTRVVRCPVRYAADGSVAASTRELLDKKFNCDVFETSEVAK